MAELAGNWKPKYINILNTFFNQMVGIADK